jgi:hypothetical protein
MNDDERTANPFLLFIIHHSSFSIYSSLTSPIT